jgi:hypothetical protein
VDLGERISEDDGEGEQIEEGDGEGEEEEEELDFVMRIEKIRRKIGFQIRIENRRKGRIIKEKEEAE